MKHINRVLIVMSLSIALVPAGVGALLLGELFTATTQFQLEDALEQAKDSARQSATWESLGDESEKMYRDAHRQLQELGRQKRATRLKIAAVLLTIANSGNRRDQLLHDERLAERNYGKEEEDFASFLRFAHVRQLNAAAGPVQGGWILRRLLGISLGDSIDADLRDAALAEAREQILQRLLIAQESGALSRQQLHAAAGAYGDELADLRDEHQSLRDQYRDVLKTLDAAERNLRASAEELEQIQRDTAQVEADIMSMQSELARIDGRLRSRAERELVQKGLMADGPDRFKPKAVLAEGKFVWPVSGPVSAGFHDANYQKYFGMPHQAVDIVVPFGTSVAAASDGIVFLVRLGGAKGYTYILIGHRGGYATVYGHLSDVSVRAGDTVSAGQPIGLTGGTPGTEGAGKMTTGAHLHFEVILRGEHIDPETVLP